MNEYIYTIGTNRITSHVKKKKPIFLTVKKLTYLVTITLTNSLVAKTKKKRQKIEKMVRILITGSTDGFGLAAARELITRKHTVYLHARNPTRAADVLKSCPGAAGIFTADLTSISETRNLAAEANTLVPDGFDAVILNAGLMYGPFRPGVDSGIPGSVFINLVAPYILLCLLVRPRRLVFISSVLHFQAGNLGVEDIFWLARKEGKDGWVDFEAYCDSKFHVLLLAKAVARRWKKGEKGRGKGTSVTVVHPGWVATKLTLPEAPGKLEDGVETYVMLAEGDYDEVGLNGGYFEPNRKIAEPRGECEDEVLQEKVVRACEEVTGLKIPV
ncbi:hypothetical protein GGS20DRAFT_561923 [Poronia punctata]|nr:hypothetical protein GGS20DRAFT_561923 [Poronia punctata]